MIDSIIKNIVEQMEYNLHTCLIGRVTRVDGDFVDVQPLIRRKIFDGRTQEYPLLKRLPVLKNEASVTVAGGTYSVVGGEGGSVTIPEQTIDIDFREYQKGDRVLVVFCERAIDGVGSRHHSLDDGFVVGVI